MTAMVQWLRAALTLNLVHFGNAQILQTVAPSPPPTPELRPTFNSAECYFCNQAMKWIPALAQAFPTYNRSDPNPNSAFLETAQSMVCDSMPTERDCYPTVGSVAHYVWHGYRISVMAQGICDRGLGWDLYVTAICEVPYPAMQILCNFDQLFCDYCTWTTWLNLPSLCNKQPPSCRVCPDHGCPVDPQCH